MLTLLGRFKETPRRQFSSLHQGPGCQSSCLTGLLCSFLKIPVLLREESPPVHHSKQRWVRECCSPATAVQKAPGKPTGLGQRKFSGSQGGGRQDGDAGMPGSPEAVGQLLSAGWVCRAAQIPVPARASRWVPCGKKKKPKPSASFCFFAGPGGRCFPSSVWLVAG